MSRPYGTEIEKILRYFSVSMNFRKKLSEAKTSPSFFIQLIFLFQPLQITHQIHQFLLAKREGGHKRFG